MKKTTLIILLLIALFLLINLVSTILYGGGWPSILLNLLTIIFLPTLAASFVSFIALICRLLANGIHAIHNRILPDNPKPFRPAKKRVLVFAVSLAVLFAIYHGGNAILSRIPDDPAEYGSFTSKTAVSSDGKYSARQIVTKPNGYRVKMVRVDIYDNETGELADSFLTERALDFWGVCWEDGTHNIWIQSGDIGVQCYAKDGVHWVLDEDAVQPDSIISKYDKYD